MRTSRREFVKLATASGIALSLSPLAMAGQPGFAARDAEVFRVAAERQAVSNARKRKRRPTQFRPDGGAIAAE